MRLTSYAARKNREYRVCIKTVKSIEPQVAWRRFRRHKMALVGIGLLIAIILYVAVGAFFYSEVDANRTDLSITLSPPSREHPFGTDGTGRDILARTIHGGQISVLIGLCAVVVLMNVGVLIGATSGYYGGLIDAIPMRFTEAIVQHPPTFPAHLAVQISSWQGSNLQTVGPLVQRQRGGHHRRHRTDQLDVPGSHRAGELPFPQGAGVRDGRSLHRHAPQPAVA